jgi:hypothetical protein
MPSTNPDDCLHTIGTMYEIYITFAQKNPEAKDLIKKTTTLYPSKDIN